MRRGGGGGGDAAYDFTDWFRLALRQEFFRDQNGARTGFGNEVNLLSTTLTAQFVPARRRYPLRGVRP
jgi:hypothetical protein